jgi:hypothetical protein
MRWSMQTLRRRFDYELMWRDPPMVPIILAGIWLAALFVAFAFVSGAIDTSLALKNEQVLNIDERVFAQFAAKDAALPNGAPESDSERETLLATAARAIGDAAVILVDEPATQYSGWNAGFDKQSESQAATAEIASTRFCSLDRWDMDLRPVIRALVIANFTGQCSLMRRLEARSFLLWRTGPAGWLAVALLAALIVFTLSRSLAVARARRAYHWLYRSAVIGGEIE